jgi:pimeloyl-ACP methyl ester carboxylesterase
LRFDTYVGDAAEWVRQLRADPRFSAVFVIGHSEGSLIGMLAAQRVDVDGFVSIAGPGRPAAAVLRDQLRPQLPPLLWEASERILARLESGTMADSIPPQLAALYRPSVQPYLISYLPLDPSAEIARLRIPVLIAQGTTDIQSSPAEANALRAANPASELLLLEGVNHVLKRVSANLAEQQSSYSDPGLQVDP